MPPSHHPSNLTLVYLVPDLRLLTSTPFWPYGTHLFFPCTCPNHLSTLWSAPFANSLSIPVLLPTSSTKLLKHFVQEHSLSFSQHFSYPTPLLRTSLVQLLFHLDTSWPFPPILYCSALSTIYTPHSFCVTTSLLSHPSAATCDPRDLQQSTSSNRLTVRHSELYIHSLHTLL